MQLRYKLKLRCQLDRLRHSLDSVKILFRLGVGGRIIPRIRLTSAKDLVEVEAELGNIWMHGDDMGYYNTCINGETVPRKCGDQTKYCDNRVIKQHLSGTYMI